MNRSLPRREGGCAESTALQARRSHGKSQSRRLSVREDPVRLRQRKDRALHLRRALRMPSHLQVRRRLRVRTDQVGPPAAATDPGVPPREWGGRPDCRWCSSLARAGPGAPVGQARLGSSVAARGLVPSPRRIRSRLKRGRFICCDEEPAEQSSPSTSHRRLEHFPVQFVHFELDSERRHGRANSSPQHFKTRRSVHAPYGRCILTMRSRRVSVRVRRLGRETTRKSLGGGVRDRSHHVRLWR